MSLKAPIFHYLLASFAARLQVLRQLEENKSSKEALLYGVYSPEITG